MIDCLVELNLNALGVIADFLVALVAVAGVGVAIWTARIAIRQEKERKRVEQEQLASALVYEIRRTLEHLSDLKTATDRKTVMYTNDFQESIFVTSQREVVNYGESTYFAISAFFAQLRNANYLRGEFQKLRFRLDQPVSSASELTARTNTEKTLDEVGNTLAACVQAAIHYGEQALDGLKPYAPASAFTATLPKRFHTEEAKRNLGLD